MEANCDDSSDVMKRLRGHRAVIIRDNRRDREVGVGGGGVRMDDSERNIGRERERE